MNGDCTACSATNEKNHEFLSFLVQCGCYSRTNLHDKMNHSESKTDRWRERDTEQHQQTIYNYDISQKVCGSFSMALVPVPAGTVINSAGGLQ
jgi:hypothetical protein